MHKYRTTGRTASKNNSNNNISNVCRHFELGLLCSISAFDISFKHNRATCSHSEKLPVPWFIHENQINLDFSQFSFGMKDLFSSRARNKNVNSFAIAAVAFAKVTENEL